MFRLHYSTIIKEVEIKLKKERKPLNQENEYQMS